MSRHLHKVVFPVAGLGTRFLPATKVVAKEMLPVLDRPLIQYAVDEAVQAGADTLVFVTNRYKHAIADYFDTAYELEQKLAEAGKTDLLEIVRSVLPDHVRCVFVTQPEARGLGHAVLCAAPVVGDEPFAVLLADDLIDGEPPILKQMTDIFDRFGRSILGVQQVPRSQTGSYGIVSTDADVGGLYGVTGIVEKPKPEVAPSTLAVVGRYVLTPRIFDHLRAITPGAGGELQLTDAIAALLKEEAVLAYPFKGTRYDCGSKLGYLQATVALARKHPEVGAAFTAWMDAQEVSREAEADAA